MTQDNRVCSRCKQSKNCSQFYSNKSRANGKASWCKECDRGYRDVFDAIKRNGKPKRILFERPASAIPGGKICTRCKKDYPALQFAESKTTTDGLTVYCRECARQATIAYRKKQKESQAT